MSSPRRPVVAVNVLSVNPSNAGTRTMFQRLMPEFARVAPEYDLHLICHAGNQDLYPPEIPRIVVDLGGNGGVPRRVLFDLFRVPGAIRGKADVLVTPSNVGPLRSPVPQVAVVAAHLALPSCQQAALPERMPWLKVQYMRWPFRRHLRRSTQVLGISEFLADGLVEELGLPSDRVRAMPLGVELPPDVPADGGDRTNTILFVGTLYRYKGAETAIRAVGAARDRLPADARLVIIGNDHRGEAARLAGIVGELGLEARVELRGSVPFDELEHQFRTAGVLLLPSVCEGFGLPVAEAMSYGLPVVCTDATSLPGVAGGAATLVPPGDVDGFADALVEVLTSPERRRTMAVAGLRRAEELSWTNAALALRDAVATALSAER